MKPSRFPDLRQGQSGAVLLVSLILLVLLTLFAIAALNFTNIQSRIAGNLQVRSELKAVTQEAIERRISTDFTTGGTVVYDFDVNGDTKMDYTVTVNHTCVSAKTVPIDQLIITNADDAQCTLSTSATNTGIMGFTPSTASLCADSIFDVMATGTDFSTATFKTAAAVTTHQGIGIRVVVGAGC